MQIHHKNKKKYRPNIVFVASHTDRYMRHIGAKVRKKGKNIFTPSDTQ